MADFDNALGHLDPAPGEGDSFYVQVEDIKDAFRDLRSAWRGDDDAVEGLLTAHTGAHTSVHGIADTSTLVLTNDARLSDARTPVAHTHAKTDITGTAITAADTGTVTSAMLANGTIVNEDINASAAVAYSKLDQARVTFNNQNASVAATTRVLAQIGTMSASRTVTLPAANAVPAGWELIVGDVSGTVTGTNTIVITRAGSDSISGGTSVTIAAAHGWRRLISDGVSAWSYDGGVVRLSDVGTVTSTMLAGGIGPSQITGTAVVTNDSRLSDARTPTAHKTSHATGGSDELTAADIGAAASSHSHAASDITGTAITASDSGTVTSAMIANSTIVDGDISSSAAIKRSKLDNAVVTFSDQDATVASTTHIQAQIGTMSASRAVTLPAANSVAAGWEVIVADWSGTVTSTNTLVITRAGSDTVGGATTNTIQAAGGWRRLISDGTSKWTVDQGVVRSSDVQNIVKLTQAQYDALGAGVVASTLYVISG